MRNFTQNSIQTFTDFSDKRVRSNIRREKVMIFFTKVMSLRTKPVERTLAQKNIRKKSTETNT